MKKIMFRSCLACFYHRLLDMIMPLRCVGLCLRYGWLGVECLGEFALLSLSEVIPSAVLTNFGLRVWEIPAVE